MTAARERLVVHVNGARAGVLACEPAGRHVFAYDADCPPERFVALTMPVRLESYAWHELHPVFQVGLPEGALQARLATRLAKPGGVRQFDLLASGGGERLGRLQLRAEGQPGTLAAVTGGGELAALMQADDSRAALRALLDAPAERTPGAARVSWLGDSPDRPVALDSQALYRTASDELPQLAFNEWCGLRIARRARFEVPDFTLSRDGRLLRIERWDGPRAARLGYEDFCALTGLGNAQKYDGTCERLVSAAAGFTPPVSRTGVRRELFRRQALAHLLRAGEAHLQSVGLLYARADDARLAPLNAALTTSVYPALRGDAPALPIAALRTWTPKKGTWRRFGAHCALSDRETQSILQWLVQALEAEIPELEHAVPNREAGEFLALLVQQWRAGAGALLAGY